MFLDLKKECNKFILKLHSMKSGLFYVETPLGMNRQKVLPCCCHVVVSFGYKFCLLQICLHLTFNQVALIQEFDLQTKLFRLCLGAKRTLAARSRPGGRQKRFINVLRRI